MKKIVIEENKKVSLAISYDAMAILAVTPSNEKGSPEKFRRLIRIRKNLVRELDALNKER